MFDIESQIDEVIENASVLEVEKVYSLICLFDRRVSGLSGISSSTDYVRNRVQGDLIVNGKNWEESLRSTVLRVDENLYKDITKIIASTIAFCSDIDRLNNIKHPKISANMSQTTLEFYIYAVNLGVLIADDIDEIHNNREKSDFERLVFNKKSSLNKGFYIEFSDGDINRIQELINELREEIPNSNLFEEEHKSRLLKRLEGLQSEVHKKMSDIDRIWGLVGDAGVALNKFGHDAKPIVDRIKEIAGIAWNNQARAEELPSNSQNPLLTNDSDENE